MAIETKCQTPDAQYETKITGSTVLVLISLPIELDLTEDQASLLEANLHNAVELVLAPLFIESQT